jgi:hypothetical protein
MRKSYFLLFGSSLSLEALAALVNKRLDVEFEHHDSSYVGEYLKYSGLYADKLTIEKNRSGVVGDFKEEKFKNFPTLIYVSITSGKNREKLSKVKYIKTCLCEISGIKLIRESLVEDGP